MVTKYANFIKEKTPSWFYKLAAQSWIDRDFPRHLFIEVTAACNLHCDFCPRERIAGNMDFGLFRDVIKQCSSHGPRSFSLHLFGEPLLYPRIFEAIEFIKRANRWHTVLLTTNGTLLEKHGNLDKLLSSGTDQVLWSWRPEAKFTEETKERLKRWGKFRVRFIAEVTPKEAYEEWGNWPNQEGRKLHNYGGSIDISGNRPQSPQLVEKLMQAEKGERWPCYHLWLAPSVAWNGNLLLCCADPHQREVLGRFPEMSIQDFWKSPRLNAIRKSHLMGQYGGICENCDVWRQYPDMFYNFQKSDR